MNRGLLFSRGPWFPCIILLLALLPAAGVDSGQKNNRFRDKSVSVTRSVTPQQQALAELAMPTLANAAHFHAAKA